MLYAIPTLLTDVNRYFCSLAILLLHSVMRASPHHDVGVILTGNSAVGAVMGWGILLFLIALAHNNRPHRGNVS